MNFMNCIGNSVSNRVIWYQMILQMEFEKIPDVRFEDGGLKNLARL